MEKNDFLLFNEIVYHIHTCEGLENLKKLILSQVKLMIPYSYASIITVDVDPETRMLRHSNPYCHPENFSALEEAWMAEDYKDYTLWMSQAPESVVVRSSELMEGDKRLSTPVFLELYQQYNIYDTLGMNLTYNHQTMAIMTLYRTRADGLFTDQESFYLRSMANHINYAYYTQCQQSLCREPGSRSMKQLVAEYQLTRREEEILSLVFRDLNNDEILTQITVSRHTLLKHLQNIYRKCGVSSRLDLLKLRP